MEPVTRVEITKFAQKQLRRLPAHIVDALRTWAVTVERIGIREARRLPGLHDELLRGNRAGQRSVRLNRAYRAIYEETIEGVLVTVVEVNKHDY
jgi:toxin HigB-1